MDFYSKLLSALLSGTALTLALPPYGIWPLALVGFVPLCGIIRSVTPLEAAGWGWLVGFLVVIGSSHWLAPLIIKSDLIPWAPVWLMAAILMCGYLALIYALWAGLCRWLSIKEGREWGVSWLLCGPLLMAAIEGIFPFFFGPHFLSLLVWKVWPLTQIAELGGPTAVSALIMLINIIIAECIQIARQPQKGYRRVNWAIFAATGVLLLSSARGLYIIKARDAAPQLSVGLVQPNFSHITSIKERAALGNHRTQALHEATTTLTEKGADLIVWPEAAWPYVLNRQLKYDYMPEHPQRLRPPKSTPRWLLIGTYSQSDNEGLNNSFVMVNKEGHVAKFYDKGYRVPFFEYIPLAEYFSDRTQQWLQKNLMGERPLIKPSSDYINNTAVLTDGPLSIGTMICYDELHHDYIHTIARQGPNLLASAVSNTWSGGSPVALQHLALATYRAIETRRDMVRATNIGPSAFIDSLGRVHKMTQIMRVDPKDPPPPKILEGNVALINHFALGPYTARFFPYLSLMTLFILAAWNRWNRKTVTGLERKRSPFVVDL